VPPPLPPSLSLRPITWQVLTDQGKTLFCATPQGYEALAFNMSTILQWILDASAVMDFYGKDDR
jgi:hypothetical protein